MSELSGSAVFLGNLIPATSIDSIAIPVANPSQLPPTTLALDKSDVDSIKLLVNSVAQVFPFVAWLFFFTPIEKPL